MFHNSGRHAADLRGDGDPRQALGFYPDATGGASLVRWTAPAAGSYAIDVTFTGLSTPVSRVSVGVIVKGVIGPGSMDLNATAA